ncbi:MAG: hypothetical protein EOO16_14955 [Chitinophagaceae bacterium]|nr:MAG: hypothetical protein EOO16_14955 [Chitinophagaceae bacterium]
MRHHTSRISVFAALLCILWAACSDPEYRQGSRVVYYPQRDVYRDEDNSVYLVFDSVEQQWTRQDTVSGSLGKAIPIAEPAVPVYRENAQHRLIYGTASFADRNELSRKRLEDSLASVPKTPKVVPPEDEPKRKTKIGRWLEKVFGKKEKS